MDKLWHFLNIALDVFPFIFLQYLPFQYKLKLGYTKTMLICSAVMLVQFCGFVWVTGQPFCTPNIMLYYRFGSLIILLVLTVIFVRDHFAKVYFIFGLMTPYAMAIIAVGSYFSFLLRNPEWPVYMFTSLLRIAITAISFPFIYLLAKKYLLPAMKIGDEKMWRYALPVPMVFSLVCIFFVDPRYELDGVSLKILFGMLFVFFGCIFTCYFLLKALRQVQEKTELEGREKQIRQLLAMQGEQYAMTLKNIKATRAARHDLRHHLSVIKELTAGIGNVQLDAYIDQYIESLPVDTELVVCKNYAVNSIGAHYITLAKSRGIHVEFQFQIERENKIPDTDLCIIIGNLMENAIEGALTAPEGKRFISVYAKSIGGKLSLVIDNSFDGIVQGDGDAFLSRKRDGKSEGIGLSSVSAVVEKLGGRMKVEYTEDTFMVSVLLSM